tara:strand:+ start:23039 stop:25081 length:2043 start_codon:yes stop_codon:yes gene_type:complete
MTTDIKINENDGFLSTTMTGGETAVDFDFPIFKSSDLKVIETDTTGAITELTLNTDYTIPSDSIKQQSGGTINLTSASYPTGASAGHKFTTLLNVAIERTTDFNVAGDFRAETLNQELDLTIQMIQRLSRDSGKSAKLSDDLNLTVTLPTPTDNQFLAWDGTAGQIKNAGNISSIADAGTSATNAANSAAAAALSATDAANSFDSFDDRYLGAKTTDPTVDNDGGSLLNGALYYNATESAMKVYDTGSSSWSAINASNPNIANVIDYGAVADNSTDSTQAFIDAIATGNPVFVPAGKYKTTAEITISGTRQQFTMDRDAQIRYTGSGTALTVTGDGHLITIGKLITNDAGSPTGDYCLRHYDLSHSRIEIYTIGACNQAVLWHDAASQTANAGNNTFIIDRMEAGSVPYGIKIDGHPTHIYEGNSFNVRVIYSATNTGLVIGTDGNTSVRYNDFNISIDAQGITPKLIQVNDDNNFIFLKNWAITVGQNGVVYSAHSQKNFMIVTPGVQNQLPITDNGNNSSISPSAAGIYELRFQGSRITPNDNIVGCRIESEGGGITFRTNNTERLRISSAGFTTDNNSLPAYFPRAWGTIRGTSGALLASQNVSVIRLGTGQYSVTFNSSMPNANYSVMLSAQYTGQVIHTNVGSNHKTSSGFRIISTNDSGRVIADATQIYFCVFA